MAPLENSPVLAIVGPTASGKSDLALFLAERFSGEIVNCDSIQVFRELNIGSAKTPFSERRGIPHHLVDVLPFTEQLTAGSYAALARPVIRQIQGRGNLPVVVGGTGLYLRALFDGLSPAPQRNQELRDRLEAAHCRHPVLLWRLLRRLDSASAARIHKNDAQKLIRAIEISSVAKEPASTVQRRPRDAFVSVRVLKIGLCPERSALTDKINARSETMFRSGLVAETGHLLEQLGDHALPRSLQSLGYRQAVAYLQGHCTLPEAIGETQARTRQYVKRQLTWFRADLQTQWLSDFGQSEWTRRQAAERVARWLGAMTR